MNSWCDSYPLLQEIRNISLSWLLLFVYYTNVQFWNNVVHKQKLLKDFPSECVNRNSREYISKNSRNIIAFLGNFEVKENFRKF